MRDKDHQLRLLDNRRKETVRFLRLFGGIGTQRTQRRRRLDRNPQAAGVLAQPPGAHDLFVTEGRLSEHFPVCVQLRHGVALRQDVPLPPDHGDRLRPVQREPTVRVQLDIACVAECQHIVEFGSRRGAGEMAACRCMTRLGSGLCRKPEQAQQRQQDRYCSTHECPPILLSSIPCIPQKGKDLPEFLRQDPAVIKIHFLILCAWRGWLLSRTWCCADGHLPFRTQ